MIMTVNTSVVTWLRGQIAVLLPRMFGFYSRPFLVRIAIAKVVLGQLIGSVLQCFPISVVPTVLHNCGFIEQ
jgi:hypothetical protein